MDHAGVVNSLAESLVGVRRVINVQNFVVPDFLNKVPVVRAASVPEVETPVSVVTNSLDIVPGGMAARVRSLADRSLVRVASALVAVILNLAVTRSLGIAPAGMAARVRSLVALILEVARSQVPVASVLAVGIPVSVVTHSPDIVPVDMGAFNGIKVALDSHVMSEDQGRCGVVARFHITAHPLVTWIRILTERSRRTKSCSYSQKST